MRLRLSRYIKREMFTKTCEMFGGLLQIMFAVIAG